MNKVDLSQVLTQHTIMAVTLAGTKSSKFQANFKY